MNFDKETIEGCVRVAKGCLDYGGGYRGDDDELKIFHHGIQTVVNSLNGLLKGGFSNTQVAALHRIGKNTED